MNIFEYRKNLKPYEYPQLTPYVDAIRNSYWIHTEFNFTGDIQDFKVSVNDAERLAIKRTMLSIAQIEVSVKTFWWNIYNILPKPEVGLVGQTFAESECRHMDAYSHLLEVLWLNNEFEELDKVPEIMWRVDYLQEFNNKNKIKTDKDYVKAIILFSLFIEHISLFSQFYIMMAFNKYRNIFKGISNVVEATSKEEQIHGMFWIELVKIIQGEHPEWFDDEFKKEITRACEKAMMYEENILKWIFEKWEIDFMPINEISTFIKNRFNKSLISIWMDAIFEVDDKVVERADWFDDEVLATKHTDFFYKRPINYNKKSQSITWDDLF